MIRFLKYLAKINLAVLLKDAIQKLIEWMKADFWT